MNIFPLFAKEIFPECPL